MRIVRQVWPCMSFAIQCAMQNPWHSLLQHACCPTWLDSSARSALCISCLEASSCCCRAAFLLSALSLLSSVAAFWVCTGATRQALASGLRILHYWVHETMHDMKPAAVAATMVFFTGFYNLFSTFISSCSLYFLHPLSCPASSSNPCQGHCLTATGTLSSP